MPPDREHVKQGGLGPPVVACTHCRKRKVRCDRQQPCSTCRHSYSRAKCVYDPDAPLPPRKTPRDRRRNKTVPRPTQDYEDSPEPNDGASSPERTSAAPRSSVAATPNESTPSGPQSAQEAESMQSRIRQLEDQLLQAKTAQSPAPSVRLEKRGPGRPPVAREKGSASQTPSMTRNGTYKTNPLGQNHRINGAALFQDILKILEPKEGDGSSRTSNGLQKCKSMAREIKWWRTPTWPLRARTNLPPKDVADKLVDCYLRTTETVYRILHLPSFRRSYEAFWKPGPTTDAGFLVQLKLVLAIGATTYDEQFSLRAFATYVVYEAQSWLSEPDFKARLTLQSLQNNLLLILARESTGVGGELIWITAGSLLRTAVYMGLHRDPSNLENTTVFTVEMRRRLWNTILEINLQASMTSGGAPNISIQDFDTLSPRNFHDSQLSIDGSVPKPDNEFTQCSIAIALRKTFPIRLAITKFLNDIGSRTSYDEMLKLDTQLRDSYKTLCRTLQEYNSIIEPAPSKFALRVVDFIMHRYRLSLHIPFFGLALKETKYAFSRKVAIDTSLKIWYAVYPPIPMSSIQPNNMEQDGDLSRLTICSSGFFHSVTRQAGFIISAELRTQLQEEEAESMGPISVRPDLLSVLDGAKSWALQCIEAGEIDIKGYILICLVAAQIKDLMRGLREQDFPEVLWRIREEAEKRCGGVLEELAMKGRAEGTAHGSSPMPVDMEAEFGEDCDIMVSEERLGGFDFVPDGL